MKLFFKYFINKVEKIIHQKRSKKQDVLRL